MKIKQTNLRKQYYRRVIKLYYESGLTIPKIAHVIPVGMTTIWTWIHNFAAENPEVKRSMRKRPLKSVPPTTLEPQNGLSEDVKELQTEVARLREALRQEKLRADAYDTMITIAEDVFKIPIRKKSGAER